MERRNEVVIEGCRYVFLSPDNRYAEPPAYAMRVGPGTDAVVWKICDTNETVEL